MGRCTALHSAACRCDAQAAQTYLDRAVTQAPEDERVGETQLKRTVDKWWPELDERLQHIAASAGTDAGSAAGRAQKEDVLEEILELCRAHQRTLTDPARQLPPPNLERTDATSRRLQGRGDWARHGEEIERVCALLARRLDGTRNRLLFESDLELDQSGRADYVRLPVDTHKTLHEELGDAIDLNQAIRVIVNPARDSRPAQ